LWNDYSYPAGADVNGLFSYYLERVPDGIINNRFDPPAESMQGPERRSAVYSDFATPEYSTAGSPEFKWETCRGIGTSFGYNRQESARTYMSPSELIHVFVDVVARGGNLLINVGPTASGDIPWAQAERLLALGWWLRINGEAIYSTRPWRRHVGITGDGLHVRYTSSPDAVHAIVLGIPSGTSVELDVRLDERAEVTLEGRRRALGWSTTPAGVRVQLPEVPDNQPTLNLRLAPTVAVHPCDGS
jgi:alpha-L-fucosidase